MTLTRLATSIIMIALLATADISTPPLAGETRPEVVTSDTPEYCFHLHDRITHLIDHEQHPPPAEVGTLSAEGERLCERGQPRPGILRLRQALHLMLDHTPSDAPPRIFSLDPGR
jgi:hypothetical protein